MTVPRPRRKFDDEAIDRLISELTAKVGVDHNDDLIRSLIVTSLDMDHADTARLELKIASQTLSEILNAWRVFGPYRQRPKVTIFGSARTKPDHPDYLVTKAVGAAMADRGWMAITGAGPGIMTAGIEGAGTANSFGVNIVLPFEQDAAEVIADDPKLATFRYFFTRKLAFMKESDAFILAPGGFGTLDEAFELLTLIQTGKSYPAPIVLLDHDESEYWSSWLEFVEAELLAGGMISPADTELFLHTHDVEEACRWICDFYSCYHSIRYVGKRLIIRLRRELNSESVARLNDEFADIIAQGEIEPCEATDAERRDQDHVDLPRLGLHFNNRSFARLVVMIRRINELEGLSGDDHADLVHDLAPGLSDLFE